MKPPWIFPASKARQQPPAPSLFEPGPNAPNGFWADTGSSGRTPTYGTDNAGRRTSTLPETQPPGWIVGPGQTVRLNPAAIRTLELLQQGIIQVCADQSRPDTTTPAHMIRGVAGFSVATAQHPEIL